MSHQRFSDGCAPDFRERKLAAEDVLTPPNILIKLACDSDKGVRRAVAANNSAPLEALLALMWQHDYDVKDRVSKNAASPSEIFVVVVPDPSTKVLLRDKWAHTHELSTEPYRSVFSRVRESARRRLQAIHTNNWNASEEFGWVPANEISAPETLVATGRGGRTR